MVGGLALWVLLAAGGVEPALAGVVAGVLVPDHRAGTDRNPAELMERRAAPVSAFLVLPLFALANAGIVFHTGMLSSPGATAVFAGIAVARVVGKLVGITLACFVVVRLGLGRLPEGVLWSHVAGGAAVAGIGFTVPLLIAEQAFSSRPPLVVASELGLLVGSTVAFGVGAVLLAGVRRRLRRVTGGAAPAHRRHLAGSRSSPGDRSAVPGPYAASKPPGLGERSPALWTDADTVRRRPRRAATTNRHQQPHRGVTSWPLPSETPSLTSK